MSYDNVLFAITIAGLVLSLAYFRVAYRQWRFEKAVDARRMNTAAGRAAPAPIARKKCQVLAFKAACTRKAGDARGTDGKAVQVEGEVPARQHSSGSV